MSDIQLDIPDITVVVDKGDEYIAQILPPDQYLVYVTHSSGVAAIIQQPDTIVVPSSDSLLKFADYATSSSYALTASYALNAVTELPEGVVSSSTQAETWTVASASYAATASYIDGGYYF